MPAAPNGVAGSSPATPTRVRISNRTTTVDSPAVVARFWAKVDIRGPDECWPWHKAIAGSGYGSFSLNGQSLSSHRIAYRLANGAWPDAGLLIRHKCDNRACCNPQHLETGNHAENARDMVERGRARNGPSKGEKNGNAKLNGEAVAKIRELLKMGQTNTAIAKNYGVTHAMISCIRRGKSWKD